MKAYAPGLKVVERCRHRCRRLLPISGEVLVRVGDRVQPRDPVAQTRLPGVIVPVNLAQQLAIPLHGFSSFLLIARRLAAPGGPLNSDGAAATFWLHQELPRRGTVAGAYGRDPQAFGGMAEQQVPRLFRPQEPLPWQNLDGAEAIAPAAMPAQVEPEADAAELLALGELAHAADLSGPWGPVLPLYPTSPVEGL